MYIKFTKPQNINVSCTGLEPDKNQTPSCATQMSKNKSRTEVCICAKGQLIWEENFGVFQSPKMLTFLVRISALASKLGLINKIKVLLSLMIHDH